MANPTSKIPNQTQIEVHKSVLLSGTPFATFIPSLAQVAGGDIQAIVYYQLHYLSRENHAWHEEEINEWKQYETQVTPEDEKDPLERMFKTIESTNNIFNADLDYKIIGKNENGVITILGGLYASIDGNYSAKEEESEEELDPTLATEPFDDIAEEDEDEATFQNVFDYYEEGDRCGYEILRSKRISASRLQRQLPFVSKRWIKETLKELETRQLIQVKRSNRVNTYSPTFPPEQLVPLIVSKRRLPEAYSSRYIVVPLLAKAIGLNAAIVLQQIHLRLIEYDGSVYVIRSLADWQAKTFPFWSLSTVKRVFRQLKDLNLLIVKPHRCADDSLVNSYRINYIGLAAILGLPIPEMENPYNQNATNQWERKSWDEWTNPVSLVMQKEMQISMQTAST